MHLPWSKICFSCSNFVFLQEHGPFWANIRWTKLHQCFAVQKMNTNDQISAVTKNDRQISVFSSALWPKACASTLVHQMFAESTEHTARAALFGVDSLLCIDGICIRVFQFLWHWNTELYNLKKKNSIAPEPPAPCCHSRPITFFSSSPVPMQHLKAQGKKKKMFCFVVCEIEAFGRVMRKWSSAL